MGVGIQEQVVVEIGAPVGGEIQAINGLGVDMWVGWIWVGFREGVLVELRHGLHFWIFGIWESLMAGWSVSCGGCYVTSI